MTAIEIPDWAAESDEAFETWMEYQQIKRGHQKQHETETTAPRYHKGPTS